MSDSAPSADLPVLFSHSPRASAADALARLARTIEEPGALTFNAANRAALGRALDRVGAQLLREEDLTLTIALAGGSGAGKSTLINALAGSVIAEAAAQRPCTMQATVYHHRNATSAGLPADLLQQVRTVTHERPELRFKVLIDTPDLDTFATQNRAATRALLKAAGLVIYVFTPEKYWDERVWSVIREEQRFSACLAVLNKSDTVPAAALEKAAEEIRRRFADLGKPDLPILRVSALRHLARADGSLPPASPDPARTIDEFSSLRAYIEYELREGDIARMRIQQRLGVVNYLEQELAQIVPTDLPGKLDRLSALAETQIDEATAQLGGTLANRMAMLEADLRPLTNQRKNQQFYGPFRVWVSAGSLVSDGIPRLGRRLRLLGGAASEHDPGPLAPHRGEVEDQLRNRAARLRDAAFAQALPIDRWRSIASETEADKVLGDLAGELQGRFLSAELKGAGRLRAVAWSASLLGSIIPVALAAYALWALLVRLSRGQFPSGPGMLGLVIALTVLAYVVLQALTAVALTGTGPPPVSTVGPLSIHAVLKRTLGGWISAYRQAIEADLHAIQQPIAVLRAVAEAPLDQRGLSEAPRHPSPLASLPRPALTPVVMSQAPVEPEHSEVAVAELQTIEPEGLEAETPVIALAAPAVAEPIEGPVVRESDRLESSEPVLVSEPAPTVAPVREQAHAEPSEEEPLAPVPTERPADLFRKAFERQAGRGPKP